MYLLLLLWHTNLEHVLSERTKYHMVHWYQRQNVYTSAQLNIDSNECPSILHKWYLNTKFKTIHLQKLNT